MMSEKQFPVKVIYQKPSFAQKQQLHKACAGSLNDDLEGTDNQENHGGNGTNVPRHKIHLKQEFPKVNAISDSSKLTQLNHRPKSATTQSLKKDQVQRTKLGPNNTKIKPQISYVSKAQIKKRPNTAEKTEKSKERIHIKPKEEEPVKTPQNQTEIPFAQNRFQGQFGNLTKDLVKKAQEALKEEKLQAEKLKQEQQVKKEKEKQLQEDVRKKNQEQNLISKEKGAERIDFRKREEELKEKLRKDENKQERDQRVEARKKRKEEGRKVLGLDIFDEKVLEQKALKNKELQMMQQQKEKEETFIKKPVVEQAPKNFVKQPQHPLFKNKDIKDMLKEQGKELEQEDQQKQIDKKQLLKEQKQKRKQDQLEKQKQEELEKNKKIQNMNALEDMFKQKKDEYQKKKEFQQKVKEEQERLRREMEELGEDGEPSLKSQQKKKKAKKSKTNDDFHKDKINELKNWIDEQMMKEDLKEDDEDHYHSKGNSPTRIEPSIKVKIDKKDGSEHKGGDESVGDINNLMLMKHQMPGNHLLNEKEEAKLGPRQNRYGIYGDNGYGDIVEIKKESYAKDKQPNKKEQNEQQKQPVQPQITGKDKKKIKEHLIGKIKEISSKVDLEVLSKVIDDEIGKDEEDSQSQIVNIEKKAVGRKVLIVKQNTKVTKQPLKPKQASDEPQIPGILNIEKELQKQKNEQLKKEKEAVVVIQKWTRGFLSRQIALNKREAQRSQIEADYGYFKDQVKFNQDYNLEKFLREKKKLREKNKTESIGESSEIIVEKIGFEQSGSIKSSGIAKQSFANPNEVRLQNFFHQVPTNKDPLSLISIFAKKHAPKQPPISSPPRHSSLNKRMPKSHHEGSASSIIDEVYSQNFDDDQKSDIVVEKRNLHSHEDIEEDILEGSKGGMSSSSAGNRVFLQIPQKQQNQKQGHFNYKQSIGAGDSISEDIVVSVDRRSRRSPGEDSSIAEESHLQQESHTSSVQKRQRQYEDSIKEEVEGSQNYDDEAFDSYSGSIALQKAKQQNQLATQQKQQQQSSAKAQMVQFQEELKEKDGDRKQKLHDMLDEIKRYEQASVSTVVVERMEKIINSTLHQKDKLILVTKLHEVEMEKKHQEEINKIREEQIKLLSQVMLMNNSGGQMNEEERKQMLENIAKIVEKPVTIVHEETKSKALHGNKQSESDEVYEEKEELDYIEESRQLQSLKRKPQEDDSIAESIPDGGSDEIEEEIPDVAESHDSSKMSEDEIKESLYVDGNKQQDKKDDNQNKDLQKMRIAFGSEETIRQQSKKALKESGKAKQGKGQEESLFEKHSFENYTNQKFKELMFDERAVKEFLSEIENSIQAKEHEEKKRLEKDLKKQLISPRTFSRKNQELERWVNDERRELNSKKQKMVETQQEMGQFLTKLEIEKRIMVQKIGSPRVNKRLLDSNNSQTSMDYEDIEEDSNESMRVKQARNQISHIGREINKHSGKDKSVEAKKLTAKKLIDQKEKAIQEGIKDKLREIEAEHADELLNVALGLDIDTEIQRRIKGARRMIEESNQSELDHFDSVRSQEENNKKKKRVNFAVTDYSQSESAYTQSIGQSRSEKQGKHQQSVADSIDESIKIEESYASQSMQGFNESKKAHSNRLGTSQSIIQESIREVENSNQYSEDFMQESLPQSQGRSNKESIQSSVQKSSDRYSSNKNIKIEDSMGDDIDYSMNFEEQSLGHSQQLPHQMKTDQSKQLDKQSISVVNEDSQEQDGSQNQKSGDSHYVEEEELPEGSQSLQSSSKFQSSQGHAASSSLNQLAEEQSDFDKEIEQSSQSVEWKINLVQQQQQVLIESQRSRKSEVEEDKYSEDFDEFPAEDEQSVAESQNKSSKRGKDEEDLDNLEDLDSCPDELDQSEDQEQQVNKLTDEFMTLILQQIESDIPNIRGIEKTDLEQFQHKFPFNLVPEQKEEEKKPEPVKKEVISVVVNKQPQKTNDQLHKEKYEQHQKEQEEAQLAIERYLDLIVNNIDKKELMVQLEKPIENDPLKVLARIQAAEYEDSQSINLNESILSQSQYILSSDYFKLIENLYRAKYSDRVNLTESGDHKKQQNHKAIFYAFNDALDHERPYKLKGEPNPWSKQTRSLKPKLTPSQIDKILLKAKAKVLLWNKTGAGTKCAPYVAPPPAQNEYDQPSQIQSVPEEEKRNQVREEKLGELLTKEIEEDDQHWVDYENEDTQAKFDLADMILSDLASEIAVFLNSKMK